MSHDPPKLLVAENDSELRGYLDVAFRCLGYAADFAEDGDEALVFLRERGSEYSAALINLISPRKEGLQTLREIREFAPDFPLVVLATAAPLAAVVNEVRSWADEILVMPVNHKELGETMKRVVEKRQGSMVESHTPAALQRHEAAVVSSSWGRKIELFLQQLGSSNVPVLILGETGVGKEVLARQVHSRSARASKSFLKLNCAALPAELVESELFGYERGAFTGAFQSSVGKFDLAADGTILLDEIGDMDLKLQAKLLQVLQDGEFLRLGGKKMCSVDVRVIAATHCDLEAAISEGRFREDLYYRLNIIRIEVPPLRDRKDEIVPLAEFFLKKHATGSRKPCELTPFFKQALIDYAWPGNIRELENVIRKLTVLRRPEFVVEEMRLSAARRQRYSVLREREAVSAGNGKCVSSHDNCTPKIATRKTSEYGAMVKPETFARKKELNGGIEQSESVLHQVDEARRTAEVEAILTALNTTLWNRRRAAGLLNVEYKALLYKMRKLGIGEHGLGALASETHVEI